MNVSIVIPTLGKNGLLAGCLQSLRDHAPEDCEILVVGADEARTFSENCNRGAHEATKPYLLFLNDDAQLKAGAVTALTDVLDQHPEIGMVGSKLLYPDGGIQHAGIYFDTQGSQLHGFNIQGEDLPSRSVKGVTAACCLVRKVEFLGLGGFDEGFRNGDEDCDLGLRYIESGQQVWYERSSIVVHHESASGPARWAFVHENVARFTDLWYDRPDLWAGAPTPTRPLTARPG